MTIGEFLKILNGISDTEELTTQSLREEIPVLDVAPTIEGFSVSGPLNYQIYSGSLIGTRYYILKNGSNAQVERKIELSDDIGLYGGRFENSEQIIEETIRLLSMKQESSKRIEAVTGEKSKVDYEPIISAFKTRLELIRQKKY